jgi:hypothetical protein
VKQQQLEALRSSVSGLFCNNAQGAAGLNLGAPLGQCGAAQRSAARRGGGSFGAGVRA